MAPAVRITRCGTPPRAVHVMAADLPDAQLAALRMLLSTDPQAAACVYVGAGPAPRNWPGRIIRLHAPPPHAWFGPLRLRPFLAHHAPAAIVHAWSPRASQWCRGVSLQQPLLIDVASSCSRAAHVQWPANGARAALPHYVCRTDASAVALQQCGVSRSNLHLIPESALQPATGAPDCASRRACAAVANDTRLVVLVPPVTRSTGADLAAWGTLLAHKIRPDIRLVVPARNRTARRIRALVAACCMESVVWEPPSSWSLTDTLAIADVALFLPANSQAALYGVATAIRNGAPLVAAPTGALTTLLTAQGVRWCRPRVPSEIARAVLEVAENPVAARRAAEATRQALGAVLAPARLVSAYHAVYDQLQPPR
jgi:glycosyltransferase involved in cell wall biosynthesis